MLHRSSPTMYHFRGGYGSKPKYSANQNKCAWQKPRRNDATDWEIHCTITFRYLNLQRVSHWHHALFAEPGLKSITMDWQVHSINSHSSRLATWPDAAHQRSKPIKSCTSTPKVWANYLALASSLNNQSACVCITAIMRFSIYYFKEDDEWQIFNGNWFYTRKELWR